MRKRSLILTGLILALFIHAQNYNFDQAIKAYNLKDYDKSLDFLNRNLEDNPKHSDSYCYRALIYSIQDRNATALSDVNNAIKFSSSKDKKAKAYTYYVRAKIYSKIEENQKAIADLTVSIKNAPTDPDYLIERALLYVETKEYAKAENDYRAALKIDEGEVRAWSGIGRSYFIQKRYQDADKLFTQLNQLSPKYPLGFYYKARVDFALEKFDAAIQNILQTLVLDETNNNANNLFFSFAEKNYPLSISLLNKQIVANPQKDFWYYTRAKVYENKGDYSSAILDFTKVMELDDNGYRPAILAFRASCYEELGDYTHSMADFDESLALDTTSAYRFAHRGDVKRLMGDYNGAVIDLGKAIAIEPNEPWFYYRRGWVKDEFMKDPQGGLADYNQALTIDKNYAYTYLNRGRLYETQLKDTVKAKSDYASILALDTLAKSTGNCRQYALFHLGRTEESIAWLNKILSTYPTSGNYYDAACLYALMIKPQESIASLKQAFEHGYCEFVHLSKDDDLNNVRNLPGFIALVKAWKEKGDQSNSNDAIKKPTQQKSEKKTIENSKPMAQDLETETFPMKKNGSGTYDIKCQINDLPLNFLFDTGASDISISQTEVDFMLKNGYLSKSDILGTQNYQYANGEVEVGTKIILRKVNIGNLTLKNVAASVVLNKKAPLLIGQSALGKYGEITIDNENNTITISKKRK